MKDFLSFKQQFLRSYKFSLCISLFILLAVSFYADLSAHHSSHSSDHCHDSKDDPSNATALGLALETRFWTFVQNQQVEKFSKKISSIFQGLNIQGIYTREEQIAGLATSTLTSFEILNPKGTRSGDVLVFSYEFIVGVGSDLTPGPELTIWKKHGDSWQMVSQSYVPFLP